MTEELIFAGFGGQGVILAGKILCVAGMHTGLNVSHIPSYGAEMRGGTANCSVVVSDREVPSPVVTSPTVIVVLNEPSLQKFAPRLRPGGLLLYNSSLILKAPERAGTTILGVPANDLAERAGSAKSANMVMLGALARLRPALASLDGLSRAMAESVSSRNNTMNQVNLTALKLGYGAV